MGVEIVNADITQVPVKDGNEEDKTFENKENQEGVKQESAIEGMVEPIKFGSHGTDTPVQEEAKPVTNNFPKDAVDEWPEPKQIHSFYFVRIRPFEDPKLKIKIDQAEKEILKKNQARFQLTEALKAKRSERAQIISQLKPLSVEDRQYRTVIDDRRKEMEPLHQALGKLRGTNNQNREKGDKGVVICSSEQELDNFIQSLNYRIQHESNTLVEEKQILRDIKQLEGTRERVIANAAMKAEIQDSLGQKEAIQDQVKLIGQDLDGVRKEKLAVRTKIKQLEDELKIIDNDISSLQEELKTLSEKKDKTYAGLVELRKQRDEGNAYFYQNRSLLNNAKEHAAKKDVASLAELSNAEVEKFMSLWSNSKSFRDDYEKRILSSLDIRQLSRDGRIRNPDEKLIVEVAPPAVRAEPVAAPKPNVKQAKEDAKPSPQPEPVPAQKAKKESKKLPEPETVTKVDDAEDKENIFVSEKAKKRSETNAVDEATLKEMKRQEEIAKAKMAVERKKKLAEKAAAKAAIRAQKEAEKKLKEREKRAKKKGGTSVGATNPEEQTEPEQESAEPEKQPEVSAETPPTSKPRERKETTVRYRRGKGQDSLPKAILKRKKSTPYWYWAAPAAAALAAILMALAYYYLL